MNKSYFCLLVTIFISEYSMAALLLDATRFIYNSGDQTISINVENTTNKTYGAQVWVDNIIENDTRPTFVGTPSFFKIEGKGKQVLRIMKVSDHMPSDVESVYWLNLQEIPPLNKGGGLSMAIRTRVKLIYRPGEIKENRDNAEQSIKISVADGRKYLINSTPFILAIGALHGKREEVLKLSQSQQDSLGMFLPGNKVDVTGLNIQSVSALNDYGNLVKYEINNEG